MARYTYVVWDGGCMVYDGDEYITNDPVNERDMMVAAGVAVIVDVTGREANAAIGNNWGAPLSEMLAAVEAAGEDE